MVKLERRDFKSPEQLEWEESLVDRFHAGETIEELMADTGLTRQDIWTIISQAAPYDIIAQAIGRKPGHMKPNLRIKKARVQRACLTFRLRWDGMSINEAARVLGVSEGTIKNDVNLIASYLAGSMYDRAAVKARIKNWEEDAAALREKAYDAINSMDNPAPDDIVKFATALDKVTRMEERAYNWGGSKPGGAITNQRVESAPVNAMLSEPDEAALLPPPVVHEMERVEHEDDSEIEYYECVND